MRRHWFIALLLAAATLALYWPARHFDLIYFDDPILLTDTPQVQAGLTWAGVKWALTSVVIANWHPVSNLSFLLVSQFFGTAPGPHHLANAVLHAANASLLFLLLWRLTGSTWRSAAAAAIFAWHPLRVESVAWIVERKDVLCAFFFLLALWFYTGYAQEAKTTPPGPGAKKSLRAKTCYGAGLLAFGLALLSKPMAVTLPCALLLLDIWPLGRIEDWQFKFRNLKGVLLEKIPFFALMILFCAATYVIQHNYAAMTPWSQLGLAPRVANSIAGYLAYPWQLIWPLNLVAIYPYPASFDPLETALKAALLLAISFGCLVQLTRRPWLAVGWFWYLGTALPIIGIIQVGDQARADRYTYLPLIGPVVALVWTVAEICTRNRRMQPALAIAAILVLGALAALSARQLQFWRNTIALFEHNVAVTPDSGEAWATLALGFEHASDTNRALVCYRVAKMIQPRDYDNRRCFASLLDRQHHPAAAEAEYRSLIADVPGACGDRIALSDLLAGQGRTEESLGVLNEAVQVDPNCTEALNNLAWALATNPKPEDRDGPRAVTLAQHACELTQYHQTIFIGTLAAAQASVGKFDDAIATAQRACTVAAGNGETNLLQRNQELLERYRARKTATDE